MYVVSTFLLGSDTSGTFSLYFVQPSYEMLERPALFRDAHTFGAKLTFVTANFLPKYP